MIEGGGKQTFRFTIEGCRFDTLAVALFIEKKNSSKTT